MTEPWRYVLIVSEEDPVARGVAERWGVPEAGEPRVDGVPVRRLAPGVGLLRRPGWHVEDDGLRVPATAPGTPPPSLVFPSVHRSATSRAALTVHPLGNPGEATDVGGRPRTLVPTDPRRMADALRKISEVAAALGWASSFEATHHGPAVEQPAFFVEIGAPDHAHPPEAALAAYARLLPALEEDPRDRVALGLGGGHYAPHFSELVLERQWAFGHLLPRHARAVATPDLLARAAELSPGLAGTIYHRAEDLGEWRALDPPDALRETEAPRRTPGTPPPGPPTPSPPDAARSAGT